MSMIAENLGGEKSAFNDKNCPKICANQRKLKCNSMQLHFLMFS